MCAGSPFPRPLIPTAPPVPGEGALTIVLRDDGQAIIPGPEGNSRWLLPPKVHEQMAEQHGFFDVPTPPVSAQNPTVYNPITTGVLNSDPGQSGQMYGAAYDEIDAFNDGTLAGIPGITSFGNADYPYLPATPSAPGPSVPWLPDPAAFGLAINGLAASTPIFPKSAPSPPWPVPPGFFGGASTQSSYNFLDMWVQPSSPTDPFGAWQTAWPSVSAKLLQVVAAPVPTSSPPNPFTVADWNFTAATDGTPETLQATIYPGQVSVLQLSSILPYPMAGQTPGPGAVLEDTTHGIWTFGLWPALCFLYPEHISSSGGHNDIIPSVVWMNVLSGAVPQLTPPLTLNLVYAVLLPHTTPAFSSSFTATRSANSTDGTISDPEFAIDTPSTSTVTFSSTWTDPVDDPSAAAPSSASFSQVSLVATVQSPYPPAVAADPIVPVVPPPASPFGNITPPSPYKASTMTGSLTATQQFGDTKHHLVDYTSVASGRFAEFFVETKTITFAGTTPVTLDPRGVNPNHLVVTVAGTGEAVPPNYYSADYVSRDRSDSPPREQRRTGITSPSMCRTCRRRPSPAPPRGVSTYPTR